MDKKQPITPYLSFLIIMLASVCAGCSSRSLPATALTDKVSYSSTDKTVPLPKETPLTTITEPSPLFGVFTGEDNIFPPFKIRYDKSLWDLRGLDENDRKPPFRLVSKSFATCFFDTNIFTEADFEPAEYFTLDGRSFRSLRQEMKWSESNKETDRIGYQFTYPGVEDIESTPVPHGRYLNYWQFALVASSDEMADCYPLAMDLLRSFEADLKHEPTLPVDLNARLVFNVGSDSKNRISFGYTASDWMEISESDPSPLLISRQFPECSFEGYLQGTVPETKDWELIQAGTEKVFFKREANTTRPDTRVILYLPSLKGWWFEVYTPSESYEGCLEKVKELLEEIQITPLTP